MRKDHVTNIRRAALAAILVTTAIPISGFRYPRFNRRPRFYRRDVFLNVLLYMPLGFGLAQEGVGTAVTGGAALSCLIEAAQAFYRGRSSNPMDVVSNTTGSALGAFVFRFLTNRRQREDSA